MFCHRPPGGGTRFLSFLAQVIKGRPNTPSLALHLTAPSYCRPILWTSKGMISPHPYLPTLTLQPLLSSSRLPAQSFPVPDSVLESVGNFGPPRMFSISPNEQYLFAYFPSVSGLTPGIACIWEGLTLQLNWNVGPGDGIVGCWWLGHEREVSRRLRLFSIYKPRNDSGLLPPRERPYGFPH